MTNSYLLFGDGELKLLASIVAPTVQAWSSEWMLERTYFDVYCASVSSPNDISNACNQWWHAKSGSACDLYVQKQDGLVKGLILALYGDLSKTSGLGDTPSPLVGDCVNHLIIDLVSKLLNELHTDQTLPPSLILETPHFEQFVTGSGWTNIVLRSTAISLSVFIPGHLIEACLRGTRALKSPAASIPLADPTLMIQNKTLTLTAMLGDTQIDIGTLQSIAVGDVIRLNKPVNEPASLQIENGRTVCQGFLGSRDNFKSLQLNR